MIDNKIERIVAPFVSIRKKERPELCAVHMDGNIVEATDSFAAVRVTMHGEMPKGLYDPKTFKDVSYVNDNYPQIGMVIPTDKPIASVSLNFDYLARAAKAAKLFSRKHGLKDVRISFYGNDRPVVLTCDESDLGKKLEVLIMPIRGH